MNARGESVARLRHAPSWAVALAGLVIACSGRAPPAPVRRDAGAPPVCADRDGTITCVRDVAWQCTSGGARDPDDCAEHGERCVEGVGCRLCVPNEVSCDGETVQVCDPTGTAITRGATCDPARGLRCSPQGCADLCARAAEDRSYVGCEYWPVVTRNEQLQPAFSFAVAVANPQLVPALVVIDRGGAEVARRTIPSGELELIPLPWVEPLRAPGGSVSVRVPDGAYHLVSDIPVVVTQFNPLEYRVNASVRDCVPDTTDGVCHSFTNDASLLLPAHVLTGSYVVVSRPTFLLEIDGELHSSPGFVAIVGADDVPVPVEVESSAYVAASSDLSIAAMAPGDRQSFVLARGEVLELATAPLARCPGSTRSETVSGSSITYCDTGPEHDLTGTIVRANGRVAVISGHDCTFVPFDRWACDHLEEQIFPVESLGSSAIVAPTEPLRREPNILRVVSAADANVIELEPPIADPITLDRGEWTELELREGVRIRGTGPLLASLFLVGQDYAGVGTGFGNGDPAMVLAIPDAQYRRSYTFLAPNTYQVSAIDVIAPTDLRVVLDRTVVTGWRAIGDTGWSHASVRIEPGVHRIDATLPFGVTLYGFGSYTSYIVPGGLDLRVISPPI